MKLSQNILYLIPLLLLVACDLVLIGFQINNHPNPKLNHLTKGSYAANFQQLKWLIAVMSLVILAMLRQDKKYFIWILAFVFLYMVSYLKIHEYLGDFFYNTFKMSTGNKGRKIMEIFAALFLGFIFIAPIMETFKKGDYVFRQLSNRLFILLILLILFSVVIFPIFEWLTIVYNKKTEGIIQASSLIITSVITGYIAGFALQTKKISIT